MSTYSAPLKDMQFALRELAGLSEVTALPAYAEVNAELADQVLEEAAKFAREVLDPLNRGGDKQGAQLADGKVTAPAGFKEAYRKFIEAGWNGVGGQPEHGGQGLPHLVGIPVQEIWRRTRRPSR
jgi:alkylation response protein AidB-like acyl-CoA dehydrogenase